MLSKKTKWKRIFVCESNNVLNLIDAKVVQKVYFYESTKREVDKPKDEKQVWVTALSLSS